MTRSISALLVFLACAFGAASTGYFFPPGDWYAGIEKPFFNPPGLDLRARVDGPLCHDVGGGLADGALFRVGQFRVGTESQPLVA
jgi:hypothetical protein